MNTRYADENFDIKNLTKSLDNGINQFLLESNKKQLDAIFDFYNSNAELLFVSGFLGSGKTQLVRHSFTFLNSEAIILEYNCFETTILDDILLSFFEDFKELIDKEIIAQPKVKSENFIHKIASYFDSISQPILIVINSLESVLKNNKQDIVDFLIHVMQKNSIKVIITSRQPDYDAFSEKVKFERITTSALEKSLFEKFLRSEGIKMIGPVSDELYKHTRGYFLYVQLTTKIINAHKLSLIDFIDGYTKSFLTYNDFILREALSFVDPVNGHLFRLLTVIRHPISTKLLETINMYNEEKIQFFVDNLLLCREKNMIYLPDYYKDISMNSIPENVSVKLHRACVDLYSTQLPLKPFERDLLISRQTMRAEIDYHTRFLPQKPMIIRQMEAAAIEAIEYAADLKSNYEEIPVAEEVPVQNDIEIITPETKEDKIKKISFIFDNEDEEKEIMKGIEDSINQFIDYSNKILTPEEMRLPFMEIMNAANREEKKFNLQKAIAFYQLALTMKEDDNFKLVASRIYLKTARCYEKLSDWYNALKYYDMALEYFVKSADYEKFNETRLNIANVFYNTYKHDKAITMLNDILTTKEEISNELKIRAHLALASIKNDNIKEVYNHYRTAYGLVESTISKKVLSELYFKFGAVCDELNEVETAAKLYQKCIDIPSGENKFASSAMTNMALICEDNGDIDTATKYFIESLELDDANKNYSNIYESSIHLAKIYKRKSTENAITYFRKALNAAKALSDPYYLMSVNIDYGDFCFDKKDFAKALRAYIVAMTKTKNKTLEEYKPKIEQRIKDLKLRVGDEKFKILQNEVLKNG